MATTVPPHPRSGPHSADGSPPGAAPHEHDDAHPALEHPVEADDAPHSVDKLVFGVTAAIALGFLAWGFVSTSSLSNASQVALDWSVGSFGWMFVLIATAFVLFVIWLAAGKYGDIRLGNDDERPEFSTASWISMMFAAGMGIGLMFFGVAEPIMHFATPPPGAAEAGTDEAMRTAMATTLFHWTLHPWAIYSVIGLAMAYGVFRKGRPQLISAAFIPLFGERVTRGPGRLIDVLAIFATLFGSAASLGLGALQIGSGLTIVSGAGEVGNGVLVSVIAVLTAAFVVSAVSGVARGIKWLANTNMVLALLLATFVFVAGPTIFILDLIPTAAGSYVQDLAAMSARTNAVGGSEMAGWLSGWTIFYWAWWLSWAPFVGMFIARISRGRTIRQFVTGVLLVPSLVSLVWFAIFGGAALWMQREGSADIAAEELAEGMLFTMLAELPLTGVTTVLVMLLVGIFFVTGADSASIVMGSLSQRGALEPKRALVIFWGVATGAVAAVMLLVGGDDALSGLQRLTIVAGLPFSLVMVGLAVALVKDLRHDPLIIRRKYGTWAVEHAVVHGVTSHGDDFSLAVKEQDGGSERYQR
jgi:choline/carnitine/betaine transport